jgi:CRP-like cAMP-binding protein
MAVSTDAYLSNRLLACLPQSDRDVLSAHLSIEELAPRQILHNTGERFSAVYFPHEGIVSLVVDLSTGETIEAGTVGRDGVIGGAAAFVGAFALNRAVVQVGGLASVIHPDDLCRFTDRNPTLRTKLFLYQDFLLAQAQQCAACNASHPVERRLARWLLRCRDLAGRDDIRLTQEFLAEMLGVRRSSVSLVANTMQSAGLIKYRRGQIRLLDIEALRKSACECYGVLNSLSALLLEQALVVGV